MVLYLEYEINQKQKFQFVSLSRSSKISAANFTNDDIAFGQYMVRRQVIKLQTDD